MNFLFFSSEGFFFFSSFFSRKRVVDWRRSVSYTPSRQGSAPSQHSSGTSRTRRRGSHLSGAGWRAPVRSTWVGPWGGTPGLSTPSPTSRMSLHMVAGMEGTPPTSSTTTTSEPLLYFFLISLSSSSTFPVIPPLITVDLICWFWGAPTFLFIHAFSQTLEPRVTFTVFTKPSKIHYGLWSWLRIKRQNLRGVGEQKREGCS